VPAKRSKPIDRLRAICLSFPDVTERPSHGAPAFFVGEKQSFVTAGRGPRRRHE
jgi:hypothetical protein